MFCGVLKYGGLRNMPFVSSKQRRFLFKNKPKVAHKIAKHPKKRKK